MSTLRSSQRFQQYCEQERRLLARELHDDISQRLALLASDLDQLSRDLAGPDNTQLGELVERARILSEDIRRISHTLHPAIVEDLGLAAALRLLTSDFSKRSNSQATYSESNLPPSFPEDVSMALYRILQEALTNIAKHAGEASVSVRFESEREEAVLIVSDNGRGFDLNDQTGLGLVSMRERAYLAGGTLTLDSAPGRGTTIQVRLPLTNPDLPPA